MLLSKPLLHLRRQLILWNLLPVGRFRKVPLLPLVPFLALWHHPGRLTTEVTSLLPVSPQLLCLLLKGLSLLQRPLTLSLLLQEGHGKLLGGPQLTYSALLRKLRKCHLFRYFSSLVYTRLRLILTQVDISSRKNVLANTWAPRSATMVRSSPRFGMNCLVLGKHSISLR